MSEGKSVLGLLLLVGIIATPLVNRIVIFQNGEDPVLKTGTIWGSILWFFRPLRLLGFGRKSFLLFCKIFSKLALDEGCCQIEDSEYSDVIINHYFVSLLHFFGLKLPRGLVYV